MNPDAAGRGCEVELANGTTSHRTVAIRLEAPARCRRGAGMYGHHRGRRCRRLHASDHRPTGVRAGVYSIGLCDPARVLNGLRCHRLRTLRGISRHGGKVDTSTITTTSRHSSQRRRRVPSQRFQSRSRWKSRGWIGTDRWRRLQFVGVVLTRCARFQTCAALASGWRWIRQTASHVGTRPRARCPNLVPRHYGALRHGQPPTLAAPSFRGDAPKHQLNLADQIRVPPGTWEL